MFLLHPEGWPGQAPCSAATPVSTTTTTTTLQHPHRYRVPGAFHPLSACRSASAMSLLSGSTALCTAFVLHFVLHLHCRPVPAYLLLVVDDVLEQNLQQLPALREGGGAPHLKDAHHTYHTVTSHNICHTCHMLRNALGSRQECLQRYETAGPTAATQETECDSNVYIYIYTYIVGPGRNRPRLSNAPRYMGRPGGALAPRKTCCFCTLHNKPAGKMCDGDDDDHLEPGLWQECNPSWTAVL